MEPEPMRTTGPIPGGLLPPPPSHTVPSRVQVDVFHASGLTAPLKAAKSISVRVVSKGVKGKKQVSKERTDTNDPHWNERFVIYELEEMGQSHVLLKVLSGDSEVGRCWVPLFGITSLPGHRYDGSVALKELGLLEKGGPGDGMVNAVRSGKKVGRVDFTIQLFFEGQASTHVREHVYREPTRMEKIFHKDVGVEKYYEIGPKLGSGAFAVVKKGFRKADNVAVAIKYIDRTALKEGDEAMLESECAVLKSVKHPNIVRLFEIFSTPKELILVMELVTGGEMLERLKALQKYSEADAADTVRKITDGLDYLHDRGIAHRDLKPENILLTHDGDDAMVKIADFGFAKMIDMEKQEVFATACGTPEYVAPEVLSQQGYTTSCDIWSLGVVVFVMLSGRPPFCSRNQQKLFQMIRYNEVEFPPQYWRIVSPAAKDLIQNMLRKEPTERFTAKQVLAHPWLTGNKEKAADLRESLAILRGYDGGECAGITMAV